MADRFECLHCGLPVAKVPQPAKIWTKVPTEQFDEWIHTRSSMNGMPKCDKHFLRVEEVVQSGTEVPVQD